MLTRVFLVPETLYQRLQSPAYTKGKGGWQNCVRELRACEQPEGVDLVKIATDARAEGRVEGINLAIQTLRDLAIAEETEGK